MVPAMIGVEMWGLSPSAPLSTSIGTLTVLASRIHQRVIEGVLQFNA